MAKGHTDKVAVITGAANGIGQAFAQRLAQDGVDIAVVDRADGGDTVKLVEAAGRKGVCVNCDVVVGRVGRRHGEAGARHLRPHRHRGELRRHLPAEGLRRDDLRRLAAGAVDQSRRHLPGHVRLRARHAARKWGRVVNMASSTLGSVVTGFAHYVASKGGIVGFTRALATDLAADGITVNAIAPGLTRSPGTIARAPRAGLQDDGRGIRRRRPEPRPSSGWKCRPIWSARCRS